MAMELLGMAHKDKSQILALMALELESNAMTIPRQETVQLCTSNYHLLIKSLDLTQDLMAWTSQLRIMQME